MSWGAHQFEIYAVQAHLPKKMRGKVSFFGIWLGDFTPDFLSKFWVYGITIGDKHYGSMIPHQWHRGWPGMGFTHTCSRAVIIASLLWLWKRNRALTVGYLLGYAADALTDVNDSVGTMLLFPFSTLNWTVNTWSYAATIEGGKYLDAAAYYSSLGLVMDLFWLGVVLVSRACSPASTGAPRWCRPTPTAGRGSAATCPSTPCWRCTGPPSSTACAG